MGERMNTTILPIPATVTCEQCDSAMFYSLTLGLYCPKMSCPLCPRYKGVKK